MWTLLDIYSVNGCGYPGDGKTHYIKKKLKEAASSVTIAVNEAFSVASAIKKLQSIPMDSPDCAVFFNFTLIPPEVCIYF